VAIYFCQVVERNLVSYMILLRRGKTDRAMTRDDVDQLYDRLFGQTLGRNISEVKNLLGGDWILSELMTETLRLRNDLVHHWMWDRVLKQGTSENRQTMLEELRVAREQLQEADKVLAERTHQLWKRANLPTDWVQKEYERLTRLAESGEDDPVG
jgi:hypothetical protein